jgi:hypothetical protein
VKWALQLLLLFLIAGTRTQADVIETPVTSAEFGEVFGIAASKPVTGSGAVWYAQFQAGNTTSTSNTLDQWEIEVGGPSGATDYGHSTWAFLGTYDFNVAVDGSSNLTAIFNGGGAGDGYPVVGAFNEIWVQLLVDTNDPLDTINVTNHSIDSAGLSNMTVSGDTSGPVFITQSFKFHFDDKLENIGQFNLSGDMYLDVIPGIASGQEWTYTVVGVYNPDLEAEVTPIDLGSFTYDHSSGNASLTLQAAPSAAYVLKQSTDPGDFTSATTITPTAVTTGTLDGNQIITDATGKAVIQFNLGTAPRMFVRGERP